MSAIQEFYNKYTNGKTGELGQLAIERIWAEREYSQNLRNRENLLRLTENSFKTRKI